MSQIRSPARPSVKRVDCDKTEETSANHMKERLF